jgi:hypothetical protein
LVHFRQDGNHRRALENTLMKLRLPLLRNATIILRKLRGILILFNEASISIPYSVERLTNDEFERIWKGDVVA